MTRKQPRAGESDTSKKRQSTEHRIDAGKIAAASSGATFEVQRLMHELQVHRVELETQNEELRLAQIDIEQGLQRYTDLYECAPVGYLTLDQRQVITEANLTAARLLEVDRAKLIGQHFAPFIDLPDRSEFDRCSKVVMTSAAQHSCELRLAGPVENPRYVHVEANRGQGETCRIAIIDISERKRIEDSLRFSQERVRLIVSEANIGLWDWDLATNKVFYSSEWKRQIGFEDHEIANDFEEWRSRVHQDDLARTMARIKACIADPNDTYQAELRMRHKDGSYRHIVTRGSVLRDEHQRPIRMLGFNFDHTERRRGEEMQKVRDRAIQSVTQGVVITDPQQPDNPIINVNQGFELLTGYSAAEAIGHNCRLLQGAETDPTAVSKLRSALIAQLPCTTELLNYRKDGTPFWNEVSISPVWDDTGRLTHFIGVQMDVTRRRALEEQLRQAQKLEAVGRLAGGIAHDMNNVLTVINGYAELLLEDESTGGLTRKALETIFGAGERAAALTRQLLAFARRQFLSPQSLEINATVLDTLKLLERVIGEDVEIHATLDPHSPRIWADRGQITQILMNLAINARDAMPAGGRLSISTERVNLGDAEIAANPNLRSGDFVALTVADTGQGMTSEVLARIFEPFFTTKPAGVGTGLGLPTVHGIVHQAGGFIQVSSEIGQGTTFRVFLPNWAGTHETPNGKSEVVVDYHGTETVLLVEDDAQVRALTSRILKEYGYKILEAANGNEALRVSADHQEPIQLLITDVVLPGMNGQLVAQLLTESRTHLRVLYLSGYIDDLKLLLGLSQHEASFLQKPFTPKALAMKVREVLESRF